MLSVGGMEKATPEGGAAPGGAANDGAGQAREWLHESTTKHMNPSNSKCSMQANATIRQDRDVMPIPCREHLRASATRCERVQFHANSMPIDFSDGQKKARLVGQAFL